MSSRLETLEAMALLCGARLLIGGLKFKHWRSLLGSPAKGPEQGGRAEPIDRHCARVIERAMGHLPFACKCLPQAMALHWMLHRRNRPSQIVLAALPEGERGGADDLHAWVESAGMVLAGETLQPHVPLIRFAFEPLLPN